MKQFRLKAEYITSVTDRKPIVFVLENGEKVNGESIGFIDHPKFTELRDKLEMDGYIKTERSWSNGDRVLKPFKLNSITFKKDDKFPCASALSVIISVRKKK
jgi:hypothetical protein